MSTIQPASLVQSAQSTVYLTGVWLDRTLAVYVAGQLIDFSVWLSSAVTDDGTLSVVSSASVLSVASSGSGDGDSADSGMALFLGHVTEDGGRRLPKWSIASDGSGQQQQRRHRFHLLQSGRSVDQCDGTPTACFPNVTLHGADNSVLAFTAPVFNLTGYLPLVITYNDTGSLAPSAHFDPSSSASSLANFTGLDWMYYTAVECDTGMIVGLYCEPCPAGGYCPGGGRVWPLPGYWSFSETSAPVACSLPQACPGALSSPTLTAGGSRMTEVCAEGYTGQYCITCAAGYYTDVPRCLSCGLESAELTELVALLGIAALLFLSLAVAVATASANNLSTAVSAVLVVQHLSVVGKLAGQQVPATLTWLVQTFSILSMLNFDIQFIKPGCVVGELSFLTVYWCTIGLMSGVSVLFVVASAVRALLARRAEEKSRGAGQRTEETHWRLGSETRSWQAHKPSHQLCQSELELESTAATRPTVTNSLSWRWRFRARVIHSHLILGSILYLRLTTMGFQAINCTHVLQSDGQYELLLQIDMTTRCYVGTHLYSAFFFIPTLVVFSVGFPLLCFWLLYRSFHGSVLTTVQPQPLSSISESPTNGASVIRTTAGNERPRELGVEMSKMNISALETGSSSPASSTLPLLAKQYVRAHSPSSQPLLFPRTPTGYLTSRTGEQPSSRTISNELQPTRSPTSDTSWSSQHPASTPSATAASRVGHHRRHRTASEAAAAFVSTLTSAQWRKVSDSTRQLYRQMGRDTRRQETFGYIYRQLKGELYFFRLLFFATSFGFAAVSVLPANPTLRLFLTGVFLVFDLFTTSALLPFETWWRNVLSVVLSWLTVVQMFVMLALVQLGLSADGSSSVDLGHSTTAQQDSSDPNSSLTGDSNAAGRYELYLGIEIICAMAAVGYVHRETVKLAMCWLRDRLVSGWRLLCESVRGWARRMSERVSGWMDWLRGLTRVLRFDGRPRLAVEGQRDSPMVVSDEAELAMVVLGAVQRLRQEDDRRSSVKRELDVNAGPRAAEGSWVREHFDYIRFNTPRQSGSRSLSRGGRSQQPKPTSSTSRANQQHRLQTYSSLSSESSLGEPEANAVRNSSPAGNGTATQPVLGAPLPNLILPSDGTDEGAINVAVSPFNAVDSVWDATYVISPRRRRTNNISRHLSARVGRLPPLQLPPHKRTEAYAASSHTRSSSSSSAVKPQPLSPLTAATSLSPRRDVSPTSEQVITPRTPQSSSARVIRLPETRAPQPAQVLNDGASIILTRR